MLDNQEQIAFFDRLKEVLPPHYNMAAELSELLGVSPDSVYRRMRGETALAYSDLLRIQQKLNLKQSVLFPIESIEEVNFVYARPAYGNDIFSFLEGIADQMSLAHRRSHLRVSLTSDDLPFFMHFLTPGLLEFKLQVFSGAEVPINGNQEEPNERLKELFETILTRWVEADSDEVWGSAPLDSTLKQIGYYLENRLISKEYAASLLGELHHLVDIINQWSTTGRKSAGELKGGSIRLYQSELNIGEMNLMLSFGDEVAVYKSNYGYGYLSTEHPKFCRETKEWIQENEMKSILISGSGEKFRIRYINMLRESINQAAHKMGVASEA